MTSILIEDFLLVDFTGSDDWLTGSPGVFGSSHDGSRQLNDKALSFVALGVRVFGCGFE